MFILSEISQTEFERRRQNLSYSSRSFEYAECVAILRCSFVTFCKQRQRNEQRILHNNQINARALIGQSAMVYCASKLMEKSHVFLNNTAFTDIVPVAFKRQNNEQPNEHKTNES